MLHVDLKNELRHIDAEFPDWAADTKQAWDFISHPKQYLHGSFWWALGRSLRFAKSLERQKKVADWLFAWRQRAQATGDQYPPKPIFQPAPAPPLPNILRHG